MGLKKRTNKAYQLGNTKVKLSGNDQYFAQAEALIRAAVPENSHLTEIKAAIAFAKGSNPVRELTITANNMIVFLVTPELLGGFLVREVTFCCERQVTRIRAPRKLAAHPYRCSACGKHLEHVQEWFASRIVMPSNVSLSNAGNYSSLAQFAKDLESHFTERGMDPIIALLTANDLLELSDVSFKKEE